MNISLFFSSVSGKISPLYEYFTNFQLSFWENINHEVVNEAIMKKLKLKRKTRKIVILLEFLVNLKKIEKLQIEED